MNKKYFPLVAYTPLIVLIDQLVKTYVDNEMRLYQSIELLENFFHITYIRNKGAAFGMLSGADESIRIPFFLIVSIIAIALIFYTLYSYHEESKLFPLSLAMILGGAIGNMIDRLRFGEVIDFLDVHWYDHHWPAFNVADAAICVGVALLIINMLFEKEKS